MKSGFIIPVLAAAITSIPVIANEPVEEVIVTANRVEQPLSTTLPTATVITALDIERQQASDIGTLLGRISGIDYRDSGGRGSASGVFVRGASPGQVVILIDGVRTASATLGMTAIENIPIEAIERIEIVKGPASGLYGADALGGVIQVFTKKGTNSGLTGKARVTVGSHALQDYGFSMSGGNDKHQFFASFSREDTRGIDRTDLKSGGNEDRDGFDETSGSLSASFTLTDKLKAQVSYLRSDGRSEFDNTFGSDNGRYSDSTLENVATKLQYQATDIMKVSLDLGFLSDHIITPAYGSDIQTRRRSATLQSDIQVSENHMLIFGADYYEDKVSTLAAFSETERDNKGYFTQWQGQFGPINMVANLRYDDNEVYEDDTNGSIVLSYRFNDNVDLALSYGTAFKAPSFNDLYFPFYGNTDLLPEDSESYELSLRGNYVGYSWRASAYKTNVNNLIAYDFMTFSAGNVASATLEGVEFELDKRLGEWSFSANMDYLEARDDETDEYLDDRAVASANLQLGRKFKKIYVGIDMQAEHGRHDRGGVQLPGFAIWGVSAVYDATERLKISGRVDNLFDENYTLNLASSSVAYETEGLAGKLTIEYSFR
ncbi:MAG: hypothetical protein COA46_11770 [Porticoccaceae bacterium]|nr:MAG: hypothetical protein COA46_11770 [Porticoccaceae bacterium]